MTFFQSFLLGIVQGLTEFFPVSSSAHLSLAKWMMGISNNEGFLYFDLICHSGTLFALIFFLRREVFAILKSIKMMALYALALTPLVPAYFLLKPIRIAASEPTYLGFFLIFTSLLLFMASKKRELAPALVSGTDSSGGPGSTIQRKDPTVKPKDVVWIGMMQTLALIPGISRSGSTIAAARLLGWDWLAAARFSFLLSIPAILGGQALETLKLLKGTSEAAPLGAGCYIAGFLTSFLVGLVGVRFVFWIYKKGIVRPFAWYCLAAGLFALWAAHG